MLDPVWLALGLPLETTTDSIRSTTNSQWSTIGFCCVLSIGLFYKIYAMIQQHHLEEKVKTEKLNQQSLLIIRDNGVVTDEQSTNQTYNSSASKHSSSTVDL